MRPTFFAVVLWFAASTTAFANKPAAKGDPRRWLSVQKFAGRFEVVHQGEEQLGRAHVTWDQTVTANVIFEQSPHANPYEDILEGQGEATFVTHYESTSGEDRSTESGSVQHKPIKGKLYLEIQEGNYWVSLRDIDTETTMTPAHGAPYKARAGIAGPGAVLILGRSADAKDVPLNKGLKLWPLPDHGKVLSGTQKFARHVIPTATWDISPVKCLLDVQTVGQGDARWGDDKYDSSQDKFRTWGCACSSLTMALQYALQYSNLVGGPAADPGALNRFMKDHSGDFNETSVNWEPTTRDFSVATKPGLLFDTLGGASGLGSLGARAAIDDALCGDDPHPVIIGVKLRPVTPKANPKNPRPEVKLVPGHFVLVVGRDENGYLINDPAHGDRRPLAKDYGDEFLARGIVRDPPGDVSSLVLALSGHAALSIQDPSGRRTGYELSSATASQDIPDSAIFIDRLDPDDSDEVVSTRTFTIQIPTPAAGSYRVGVEGFDGGPYTLVLRAFSTDGSAQPVVRLSGRSTLGSSASYVIQSNSAPGAKSSLSIAR